MMGKHADLLSPEAMRDYFGEVYWRKGDALDKHKIGEAWLLSRSTRGTYPRRASTIARSRKISA